MLDKHVPNKLKKTQQWFASILSMPIDEDSRMNPLSPSGDCMEEEAFDYIVPSPSLRPAQRIQLYNQQYWWRLLNTLHDAVPLVIRLLGYREFNQSIGKPYLVDHPPCSWSLNDLANELPQWIEKKYKGSDKQLVLDAARLDVSLNVAFFSKHCRTIHAQSADDMQKILQRKVCLQSHVFLYNFNYDILSFRTEMLKQDVEYWTHREFPKLVQDRNYYFVIYRNIHNNLKWEEVSLAAFHLLNLFSKGITIEEACEWLEEQGDPLYSEAADHLHLWFQKWIYQQWLLFDE